MLKWHPNKDEIYAADLCLKTLGISRDVRSCIKFYLFDKFCKTDIFFQSFGVKWSEEQCLLYQYFQNNRVNFITTLSSQHGKGYFINHLTAACCQANLKTVVIGTGQRACHSNWDKIDLNGFSKHVLQTVTIDTFLCSPIFTPNVILIDSYAHLDFPCLLQVLEKYIFQNNVHIFALRSSYATEQDSLFQEMFLLYKSVIHVENNTFTDLPGQVWLSSKKIRQLKELYAGEPEEAILHLNGVQEEE
jgi:hypothetical protein